MKAITQNLENGQLQIDEVPPPVLRPGGLLVQVRRSLISLGTEKAVIALAKKGPIGKARDRPDLARKVITKAKQEGFWSTYQVVKNLMSTPIPLGYSCAGEVIAVGREAGDFQVGDRVACAGLGYANHAEIDYVPRNLAVRMPDGASFDEGAFVTVGAIAMHGVRLADITLGERVVVMGLGLVGQIAAQLARCSGATVIAVDLDQHKVDLAAALGAHHAVRSDNLADTAMQLTGGLGADAVLLCAATKSDEPLRQAAAISRLKGRVVIVGDVGMQLERRPFFEKEITLVVSRSYGPGRYDPMYETHGRDYPAAYVRWTEGRNMQSVVELIARGDVKVAPLITHRFPIDQAETAYDIVTGVRQEPAVAIVLEYENSAPPVSRVDLPAAAKPVSRETVNVGVVGAGQFARGVLLPALVANRSARIHAVCTASGLTSKHVGGRYEARYATNDAAEIFADAEVDAVLIATRHDQHAALTAAALRAGKAVFVEKPLALTLSSFDEVRQAAAVNPRLMVGFNRRFAPLTVKCRQFFADVAEPCFISYRVNAGALPSDSWALDPVEGGGRILGEACHFVDTVSYLAGALPTRVYAEEIPTGTGQDVAITLRFANGWVAVIQYLTRGDSSVSKEYFEVFGGGRAAQLDNYRTLALGRNNRLRKDRLFNQAKGHAQEMTAFVDAVRSGGPMPIDLESILAVTRATLLIGQSLEDGAPVDCTDPAEDAEA